MAVIAFVRKRDQPLYRIKKAAQAIWVSPNGDATFNLECIIDLSEVSDSPVSEAVVVVHSEVPLRILAEENDLFLDAKFCDYLYDGRYESKSVQLVKLPVSPSEYEWVKIAPVRNVEATHRGSYSRINVSFGDYLRREQSDLDSGEAIKYAGFRIRYVIPKYSKKIRRHRYTEATWTMSIRPYDEKVLGTLAKDEKVVDLEFLYYWIVLPRGFFVTAYAPALHDIRNLEIDPWKEIYPKLEKDSICYSWKLESPEIGARLHLDYREPSFDPYWEFWAFLLAIVGLLLSLLFFMWGSE